MFSTHTGAGIGQAVLDDYENNAESEDFDPVHVADIILDALIGELGKVGAASRSGCCDCEYGAPESDGEDVDVETNADDTVEVQGDGSGHVDSVEQDFEGEWWRLVSWIVDVVDGERV